MAKAPQIEIQQKALAHVQKTYTEYQTLLTKVRADWYKMFQATYVFEVQDRKSPGQSQIFFPKAFEQVEKVAPRIFGNNPKYVISLNVPINPNNPETDMLLNARANQAALNYFWKLGKNSKKTRTATKNLLVYGTAFLKATVSRKTTKTKTETIEGDKKKIIEKETTLQEFPTFEVPDVFDIYFDPRIEMVEDMPGIIQNFDNVRYSTLKSNKNFFNLDKIKDSLGSAFSTDRTEKLNKFSVQGIPFTEANDGALNYKTFYGYFSETDDVEDERLFKITTACDDTVLIGYEEIDFIPFEKINAIEVPNQGTGIGLVQPIKKLQDAYNLTRNQRFENVSLVINRMWLMRQGAGIDPRKLRSVAGNIIPVKNLDDLAPVQTPDVTASSFNEAQALNTEMQTTLGTIDTTQDSGANGFSNLATGQKIRWNEFNVRFKAIKENLEEGLSNIGEKMLRLFAAEATQNPLIEDQETGNFYEVAKTAFDSVSDFYRVSILADSTNLDSIENKRDESLAFGQLAIAYKGQGVPIPMDKVWMDIVESFPGKNPTEYYQPELAQPQQPQAGGQAPSQQTIDGAQVQPSPEDQLNQQLTNV